MISDVVHIVNRVRWMVRPSTGDRVMLFIGPNACPVRVMLDEVEYNRLGRPRRLQVTVAVDAAP